MKAKPRGPVVKKIDRLTPEQEARIPEFRDKWLKIGLSCEPCDLPRAHAALVKVYRAGGLEPPKLVLVADSPIGGAVMAEMLGAQVRAQVGDQVRAQVRDQVWDQVRAQVWDQVRDQVVNQVGDQVWAQVRAQVWDQVRAQVRAQVVNQVGDQVGAQVYGSHEAGWLSWLDFFGEAVGIGHIEKAGGLIELAQSCGWWAPYCGVAILQHRHTELHRNAEHQLHNERGPAVLYRDGFGVWALNGVRVPQWLVETPAEELDPTLFAKEPNVEVRREIIRKIGVERLCSKLGSKVLDRRGDYELHLVNLGGTTGEYPYLKMKNPSIGVYHMEAVPRECVTVQDALNFRNGGELEHLAPLT